MGLMKALFAIAASLLLVSCSRRPSAQQKADEFLAIHSNLGQKLYAITAEAYWKSMTDVTDAHVGERIGAERSMAAFDGNVWVIETVRSLLGQKDQLNDITARQLDKILLSAAQYPDKLDVVPTAWAPFWPAAVRPRRVRHCGWCYKGKVDGRQRCSTASRTSVAFPTPARTSPTPSSASISCTRSMRR